MTIDENTTNHRMLAEILHLVSNMQQQISNLQEEIFSLKSRVGTLELTVSPSRTGSHFNAN